MGRYFIEDVLNLSESPAVTTGPSIAAFGNTVYIVYSDLIPPIFAQAILFKRSTDGGAAFEEAKVVTAERPGAPQIAVTPSAIYVVWREILSTPPAGPEIDIFFTRSINEGDTFDEERNISNNPGASTNPSLAASTSAPGNVYVTWVDNAAIPGNLDILYRMSTDTGVTFHGTENLSNSPGASTSPAISSS